MNHGLLNKVLASRNVPTLPAVAMEVVQRCKSDDVCIDDLSRVIRRDPGLSARILKTVNSSSYGVGQHVSKLSRALVLLGLDSVKSVALGFSLFDRFREAEHGEKQTERIWRRTLYSAVGARQIAREVGLPEQEEIFLGGLLQDIGMIALMQALGPDYIELVEQNEDHASLWQREREMLDLDHARVGAALAERYELPEALRVPIGWHEWPEEAPENLRQEVRAIALGGRIADVFNRGSADCMSAYLNLADRWFGIGQDAAMQLAERVGEDTREMADRLDITVETAQPPAEILAEAHELLLEQFLATQKDARQLKQENHRLQEAAATDALTGAANRSYLNDFLREAFDCAAEQQNPLALILCDADGFKALNDRHGHLAGDRALITLATLLAEHSPQQALVARYGGEEFAVVIPALPLVDAARLAEDLRARVEQQPVDLGNGQTMQLSISLGVAAFDGARFFKGPEHLVQMADKAMYAAKNAGRNCVRVFTPKTTAEITGNDTAASEPETAHP